MKRKRQECLSVLRNPNKEYIGEKKGQYKKLQPKRAVSV
jgi:hypothetical protein